EERLDVSSTILVTQDLVFTKDRVAPLAEGAAQDWLSYFRLHKRIQASDEDREELLAALLSSPDLPPLEVPEELRYEEITLTPRPSLRIAAAPRMALTKKLHGELAFDYDGRLLRALDREPGIYAPEARRLFRRDAEAERAAATLLRQAGAR